MSTNILPERGASATQAIPVISSTTTKEKASRWLWFGVFGNRWDWFELAGMIAAILALATWVTRTDLVDEADSQQRQLTELRVHRQNEQLIEGVDRKQNNAARSILRIEQGIERLILNGAPPDQRESTAKIVHLMSAMENELWAQNWTEEVISWEARIDRLKPLIAEVTFTQEEAFAIAQMWVNFKAISGQLYQLRKEFRAKKQAITNMPSFDAKSIYNEAFVPDLIRAYEEHGQAARKLYEEAFEAYRGVGGIEARALALLEQRVETIKESAGFYAKVAYVLFVLGSIFGVISKLAKLRKADAIGSNQLT
jgi:hypothetical protein